MSAVEQAYGLVAGRYIELFGSTASVHADDRALIERHLTISHGPVLDIGCGPGHLTAHLQTRRVDATGVDLVPAFLDHARAAYPDGRFVRGSMRQLPAPDGSVAGILAWYSLIHVPPNEMGAVLAELRRAIAPGGVLVAGFFAAEETADGVEAFDHKVTTAYRWPVDDLARQVQRAGFAELERDHRPGDPAAETRPHAAIAARACG